MDDEIKSLHVSVHEGKWMPPDVRERMLLRVQARAFLRGYIRHLDSLRTSEEDDWLDRRLENAMTRLHNLS